MEETELVIKFYTAFRNKNYQEMISCYSEDILFRDPIFQSLKGYEVGAMWRMLIERSQSLEIKFSKPYREGEILKINWESTYLFEKKNRLISNKTIAQFRFKNGLISEHTDYFSLWSWARMASGVSGFLFGWLPLLQNKIQEEAKRGLKLFIKRKRLKPTQK